MRQFTDEMVAWLRNVGGTPEAVPRRMKNAFVLGGQNSLGAVDLQRQHSGIGERTVGHGSELALQVLR
jgi:hypothetical protein